MTFTFDSLWSSAIRLGFDVAVKATVVFVLTAIALLLMRRASAATRHRVGTFGLATALLLPILALALPKVTVPILPDVRPAVSKRTAAASALPAPRPRIDLRQLALAVPEKSVDVRDAEILSPAAAEKAPASVPARPGRRLPLLPLPSSLPGIALFAWILGAAAVAARLSVGWARVRQIGREARPIRDLEWLLERDAAAQRLDLSRRVELVESEAVPVAMTTGVLRPLLMFGRAARQWAVERRRVVLLHELAHVKRSDWPALILAETAAALYWFHPLAWWLSRRVRRDAETACDDLVIAAGTKPSVYAGHLLGIFRSLGSPAHPTPALALGVARPHHFEERLRTILDPRSAHSGESRGQARLAAVALAGAAAVLGFVSPWVPSGSPLAAPVATSPAASRIAEASSAPRTKRSTSQSQSTATSSSTSTSTSHSKSQCKSQSQSPSESESPSESQPEPSGFLGAVAPAETASPEAAEPEAEAVPEATPEAVPAIWNPAVSQSGKVEGFVKASQHKSSRTPRDGDDWYSRGMELHHEEDYEAAIEAFKNAIADGYNEDASSYNIACGYALLGNADHAFEWLKKAMNEGFDVAGYMSHDDDLDSLKSDPRWAQTKKEAREVEGTKSQREAKSLVKRYERIVARNPKSGEAYFDIGLELLRSDQYDLGVKAYQTAIDRGYRVGTAYYNQACGYAMAGNRDAAFAALRKALDNGFDQPDTLAKDDDLDNLHADPRWAPLKKDARELELPSYNNGWWKAGSRSERTKWREAAERFQEYVEKNPQSGRGWYSLGFASLAGDRPEASIEAFQKALNLGYRTPVTMYNLACAYSRLDQKDPAFEWLFKALDAGFVQSHTIRSDDDLDNLRGDPRYRKALQIARAAERDGNGHDSDW